MNINQKINELALKFFDGNNVKFAQRMDTSEANIRNYRNKIAPKADFLMKLHKELEINFDWLLAEDDEMIKEPIPAQVNDTRQTYFLKSDRREASQSVPLYDIEASAGLVKLFDKKEDVVDYILIPNLPKCDGAVYIKGDSMYPLLKSGDIVMYKQIQNIADGIFYGEMYLLSVSLDDEELVLVKYIQRSDLGENHIKLVSQNPHHSPKDILVRDIKSLALIKASVRINSMS
jgi:phage repressor protein C with HTH and peptisase S24 domain